MKVKEAMDTLRRALNIETASEQTGCQCKETSMKTKELLTKAEELVKTKAVSAEQFNFLKGMGEEDLETMSTILGALMGGGTKKSEDKEPVVRKDDDEEAEAMKAHQNATNAQPSVMSEADIAKIVDARVTEHLARTEIVGKIKTNAANKLTDKQLAAMSLDQLTAVEEMTRPVDYSGQGGFSAHAGTSTNVQPLLPRGLAKKEA